ncbi:SDR family oxidoreductase [Pectobacterium aroidearum]|uniref:SDR family oxidoreductase n=1 Tax=Pectobacterium aroidearum TaxID=1201031 RepID=A0AAW3ST60_9GAMM|nr:MULTISPECIES: SDR family oxidoreductase [Pectobacterium]MBA5198796.1 SDR family oxidoreductase [Pectobacterium aroidearum]MBA5203157.1 SDR family oxidoreductase [Pectobacterium aroidearum]MBA5226701.1 SDR family oxidoreductase [Pectobacterium aroidearum]MBA5231588.1 SDR family oxidoreductase [Pectobacterium aroidearum]MBA5736733.1 SDR family oxidoreductase [Pectobacterium aroidearum]
MLLAGKNAVITGCLQGIGRATLEAFAREGANVFACCQTEDATFNDYLIDLSEKYCVEIIPVYFDFLDEDEIKKGVAVIQKSKKSIDILVNVAGITLDAFFHMITMEQMKKTFAVNFFSQMFFTQYITKLMLRQKKGSVINVSSISALDGNPGQLSYSASKAALIAATKTLSAELAPQGIRVNAVAPGVIQTAMTANLPKEVVDRQMARCELKRLGLPEEVAKAILYLASDASSYITGQVVRIDGGMG